MIVNDRVNGCRKEVGREDNEKEREKERGLTEDGDERKQVGREEERGGGRVRLAGDFGCEFEADGEEAGRTTETYQLGILQIRQSKQMKGARSTHMNRLPPRIDSTTTIVTVLCGFTTQISARNMAAEMGMKTLAESARWLVSLRSNKGAETMAVMRPAMMRPALLETARDGANRMSRGQRKGGGERYVHIPRSVRRVAVGDLERDGDGKGSVQTSKRCSLGTELTNTPLISVVNAENAPTRIPNNAINTQKSTSSRFDILVRCTPPLYDSGSCVWRLSMRVDLPRRSRRVSAKEVGGRRAEKVGGVGGAAGTKKARTARELMMARISICERKREGSEGW